MYLGQNFLDEIRHYFPLHKYFNDLDKKTQSRVIAAYFNNCDLRSRHQALEALAGTAMYQQLISTLLMEGYTHSVVGNHIKNYIQNMFRELACNEFNRLLNEWNADFYAGYYL